MKIKTINNHCTVVYTQDRNSDTYSAIVFSYDTPVIRYNGVAGRFERLWSGWSATTQRDINKAFPMANMTKKKWNEMEVM